MKLNRLLAEVDLHELFVSAAARAVLDRSIPSLDVLESGDSVAVLRHLYAHADGHDRWALREMLRSALREVSPWDDRYEDYVALLVVPLDEGFIVEGPDGEYLDWDEYEYVECEF